MQHLLNLLALPQFGLSTVFVVAFVSATLLPLGSEPAVFGLVKLNPELFWPAILVATAGNTLGGAVSWWMGLGAHQAWTANIWSLVMDYTPKHMMGTVFGFGGMCAAIGGMFMTQFVGYVLTVTNNNYTLLFTMIPAMYFIALVWMYFMAPRKIPQV